jgi:polyadenylation factor subunit 2
MRKAIVRKSYDYNGSLIRFRENKIYKRTKKDRIYKPPHEIFTLVDIPSISLKDDPTTSITTRFAVNSFLNSSIHQQIKYVVLLM